MTTSPHKLLADETPQNGPQNLQNPPADVIKTLLAKKKPVCVGGIPQMTQQLKYDDIDLLILNSHVSGCKVLYE